MPYPKTGAAHTLYKCTMIFYDKGGTIQRAGCLVTRCQIKVAERGTCVKGSVSQKVSNKENHLFSFKNSLTCSLDKFCRKLMLIRKMKVLNISM